MTRVSQRHLKTPCKIIDLRVCSSHWQNGGGGAEIAAEKAYRENNGLIAVFLPA